MQLELGLGAVVACSSIGHQPCDRTHRIGIALQHLHAVHERVALDCTATGRTMPSTTGELIEQGLGGFAGDDAVGHGVCMLLVRIAGPANAALQLHTGALLHDMRGLVRGGMQVGCMCECNAITGGVRVGPHRSGTLGSRATDVRAYVTHVVVAEHALDAFSMWQLGARTARAVGRCGVYGRAISSFSPSSHPLYRRRIQRFGQRTRPRRDCRRARFPSLGSRTPARRSFEAHEHLPWSARFYVNRAFPATK